MQHYASFDDYLQAARIDEELELNNYREHPPIEAPEEIPEPIKVTIEEPKEEKPKKKKAK